MVSTPSIYPIHRLGQDTLSYRAFEMTSRPGGKWVIRDGQERDLVFTSIGAACSAIDLWYGESTPVRRSGP